jgi:HD-like signal output (HDOD) protein
MQDQELSVIARLLKKMDASPGFAGLGASVQTISRLSDDVGGGTRELSAAILRDAALTAKLLRIANSSRNARSGRNISTIDQALAILGMNTVKSVALSLALLDSLSHKPQSKLLHAEIVAAFFSGSLAGEITRINAPRFSSQEAQVCGLLQNLGRMMATYYLYEDIERGRALQAERNLSENEAVTQTLGMCFEDIGAAIARHWTLPDVLQASLAPLADTSPPRNAANALVWNQLCSCFCRCVAEALFRLPENAERVAINNHIEFFRGALHLRDAEVREWIEKCLAETDATLAEMSFPSNVEQARKLLRKASERVLDRLSAQDSLTKESKGIGGRAPVEVIQHVLRLIHDRYNFDHTLLCLPESSSALVAIAGVGRNAVQVTARFRCAGPKMDLFRAIMARNADTFVNDVRSPMYANLVPEWYHQVVGARSFVMLPLGKGKLLGMIYADYADPQESPPPELAQGNMRSWRDELTRALQAGADKLH